jgi:hypothetical protein
MLRMAARKCFFSNSYLKDFPDDVLAVKRFGFAVFLAALGALLLWRRLYPEAGDPKSIEYVMWEHGLNPNMNFDAVFRGMTSDSSRFDVVSGLTKEQLTRKFGYLRGGDSAVGGCISYAEPRYHATEAYGLRNSIWVVALKDNKPLAMFLCKG